MSALRKSKRRPERARIRRGTRARPRLSIKLDEEILSASRFAPVQHTYTGGSGSEPVPAGATQVVIELNGVGGDGFTNGSPGPPGNGGGGGAYCQKTLSVSFGQTFSYSFPSGNATVTSLSPAITLTANKGTNGSGGGAGGVASGGDVNTTGGNGSSPTGGSSPNGGAAQSTLGAAGNAPGGGGAGNTVGNASGLGAAGRIRFSFT